MRSSSRSFLSNRDNAARNKALPALILVREHENRVALGDMLTAIHRLLRGKRERLHPRIANIGAPRRAKDPLLQAH